MSDGYSRTRGYGLIIDQEYKNLPLERARRRRLTSIKPHWHEVQAQSAEESANWFAATFHRAWVLKARPDDLEAYDNLQRAHQQLLTQDEANGQRSMPDRAATATLRGPSSSFRRYAFVLDSCFISVNMALLDYTVAFSEK